MHAVIPVAGGTGKLKLELRRNPVVFFFGGGEQIGQLVTCFEC